MKTFFYFLFFSFIFLVGTLAIPFIIAEETPKYNFGTMQAAKSFGVKPGQEVTTKLYFYNVYGNRPTHVKLNVIEKPENWEVNIQPDITKKEYDVSGQKISVDENLVVYPSNASNITSSNTETIEYISSSVGYIASNFVTITIKVPENEKIGKSFDIKINGVASWLGQAGNIALQQERDFEYSVTTTTDYYEKPYEEQPATNQTSLGKKIISLFSGEKQLSPVTMIATGTSLILVVILIILVIITRKKMKKPAGKNKKRK